jgi:hypothetical protein
MFVHFNCECLKGKDLFAVVVVPHLQQDGTVFNPQTPFLMSVSELSFHKSLRCISRARLLIQLCVYRVFRACYVARWSHSASFHRPQWFSLFDLEQNLSGLFVFLSFFFV